MILISGVKFKNIEGITIWPFILVKSRNPSESLIFHERIHLRQQLEMLIVPFYVWYIFEWLIRLIQYRNSHKAYLNISFEREAYANEKNKEFLRSRMFWNFLQYI